MPNFESKSTFSNKLITFATILAIGLTLNIETGSAQTGSTSQANNQVEQIYYKKWLEAFIDIDQVVTGIQKNTNIKITKFRLIATIDEIIAMTVNPNYVQINFELEAATKNTPEIRAQLSNIEFAIKNLVNTIQTISITLSPQQSRFINGTMFIHSQPWEPPKSIEEEIN